jgi:YhhN-like protein
MMNQYHPVRRIQWAEKPIMFTELGNDTQALWLMVLLAVWAAFLFGGFVFGKLNPERTHRTPTWARMASSVTLVVAAWSWYSFTSATHAAFFALMVAIGMTLGAVGDLFVAKLIPVKEPILGGIASFALGHIAYIAALVNFADNNNLNAVGLRWGALVFWWLMGLGGWYFVVYRGQKHTLLHYAALPYSLLLATTAGFAMGLFLQASEFAMAAVGTMLFLLSDLLLAAQLFSEVHFTLIGDVVWLLYGPAQMLIVYSISQTLQLVK